MDEPQISDSAKDRKQNITIKRAGQNCIVLFVIFVIALFAFGKSPVNRIISDRGSRVNFDIISGIGVVVALYALFFILFRLRIILKLTTAKKVLGLIGGIGLILHSVIAIAMPLSYGVPQAVGTGSNQPMAQSGQEQWQIDGKGYRIESTYYLTLPKGLQYTIEYPWKFKVPIAEMNDERALEIVFPLMKHAYEKGLYKRMRISKLGKGNIATSRIGVTLFERHGKEVGGYKVALSLDEIKRRIEQENPPATRPHPSRATGDN
ncbi:MAG: hypothetical protein K8R91_05360 [Phycisphaerae bacterium]|nr:hypothetical protein [Phycisphaerae bacterium]